MIPPSGRSRKSADDFHEFIFNIRLFSDARLTSGGLIPAN